MSNAAPAPVPAATNDDGSATSSSKRTRPEKESITFDEFLDQQEEQLKKENSTYSEISDEIAQALSEDRILFVQRKIPVFGPTKDDSERKAPLKGTTKEDSGVTPEMREEVRKALQEREAQRAKQAPHMNLATCSAKEYERSLPPYAVLNRTKGTLTMVLGAIQHPSLRVLTETCLSENAAVIKNWMQGDRDASSIEVSRGNIPPVMLETPMLFALMQRASPETEQWDVPCVISSVRLYRWYRAVTTYLCVLLEENRKEFYESRVVPALSRVQALALEIQVIRNQKRREFGHMVEPRGRGPKKYANAEEMLAEMNVPANAELLKEYETLSRQRGIELFNSSEALICEILGVPGDLSESLYSSERVPPVELAPPEVRKVLAASCIDILKLSASLLLQNSHPTPEAAVAIKEEHDFVMDNLKSCASLFADDAPRAMDGVIPRAHYWVSAHAWAHRLRFVDARENKSKNGGAAGGKAPMKEH